MNCTSRSVAVGLFGVCVAVLGIGCSGGNNPCNYGDMCTVYSVGAPCTGSLLCRCILQGQEGCFCTQSCEVSKNCPGKFDKCLLANDPSQTEVNPSTYCFQFLPDGGPLP